MVTTQIQIIEKMLSRKLTDKEFKKVNKMTHHESLCWAKDQECKEGRAEKKKVETCENDVDSNFSILLFLIILYFFKIH